LSSLCGYRPRLVLREGLDHHPYWLGREVAEAERYADAMPGSGNEVSSVTPERPWKLGKNAGSSAGPGQAASPEGFLVVTIRP